MGSGGGRRTALVIALAAAHRSGCFLLLPLLGASLYQAYLEQGIRFRENPFLGNEPILPEYDFVVVGAGAGGSVVANRLSENAAWKVLLLEAGPDENVYTDIPATVSHWAGTAYDWGYAVERTGNACLAMERQRCTWPRGKVLGGSTVLNYMIYTRGHRRDYDDYAAAGNAGWGYADVLPYFIKSENNTIAEYRRSALHGHGGYLPVERVRHRTPLLDAFLAAGRELGYRSDIDYADGTQYGFSRLQTTQRRGRRASAAKAYLRPARGRRNLHVSIGSRVTRLLVDARDKRVYGVEFLKAGRRRAVRARKEVVLSAGALNTPQLLMLSGIGPEEHLRPLGIPVVRDLRVGENLHEHYAYLGLSFLVNATGSALVTSRLNVRTFVQWLNEGAGVLTLPGGVEGLAYVKTKHNAEPGDYPDVEYIFAAGSMASDGGTDMRKSFAVTRSMYERTFGCASLKDTWTILPMLLRPRTTGKMLLRSADPLHAPVFHFDYFRDAHDMKVLVEGIRGVLKLSETRAFRRLGTRLTPQQHPLCARHPPASDQYWECMARHFTATLHHQSGTCKMGPATDRRAVVDPQLRVHGVKNLRVADASVFPKVPGAHLYAPTLMVGEKAADLIKASWMDDREAETRAPHHDDVRHTSAAPQPNLTSAIDIRRSA